MGWIPDAKAARIAKLQAQGTSGMDTDGDGIISTAERNKAIGAAPPKTADDGSGNPATDDGSGNPAIASSQYTEEQQAQIDAAKAAAAAGGYGYGLGAGAGAGGSVHDPEAAYARITREQYADYVRDFRDFELELIDRAKTDTSLIDQARVDSAAVEERTRGIAQRNLSRYGANLTPAQQQEMERSLERGTTLGGIQSVADATLAQRGVNQQLLSDIINIGQEINRTSLQALGSAAGMANQRENAYRQAQAQHKQATYGAIGSLASTAILAAFMI